MSSYNEVAISDSSRSKKGLEKLLMRLLSRGAQPFTVNRNRQSSNPNRKMVLLPDCSPCQNQTQSNFLPLLEWVQHSYPGKSTSALGVAHAELTGEHNAVFIHNDFGRSANRDDMFCSSLASVGATGMDIAECEIDRR